MQSTDQNTLAIPLRERLAQLSNKHLVTWWESYCVLRDVESSKLWEGNSDSFTQWITTNSGLFKKKPSQLWRILSSGRYLEDYYPRYSADAVHGAATCPSLESIAEIVRPEHLELLSKLERVMPKDRFHIVAHKTFEKQISRLKLREMWLLYKPALQGRTARGRGVKAPHIDQSNENLRNLIEKSRLLDILSGSESTWTGVNNPILYKIFINIMPEGVKSVTGLALFPAVTVIMPYSGRLELHGLRWLSIAPSAENYKSMMKYCDFLWGVRANGKTDESDINAIPNDVGILEIAEDKVTVIRRARPLFEMNCNRDDLACAIIKRILEAK